MIVSNCELLCSFPKANNWRAVTSSYVQVTGDQFTLRFLESFVVGSGSMDTAAPVLTSMCTGSVIQRSPARCALCRHTAGRRGPLNRQAFAAVVQFSRLCVSVGVDVVLIGL